MKESSRVGRTGREGTFCAEEQLVVEERVIAFAPTKVIYYVTYYGPIIREVSKSECSIVKPHYVLCNSKRYVAIPRRRVKMWKSYWPLYCSESRTSK